MEQIISSQKLQQDRRELPHKFKWATQAISLNNNEDVQKLAKEIESLSSDASNNEKIGVQFRALLLTNEKTRFVNEKGQIVIDDVSGSFERGQNDSLLNGTQFLEMVDQYKEYSNSLEKKHAPEVTYYYYALDLKNNKEEAHHVDILEDARYPFKDANSIMKNISVIRDESKNSAGNKNTFSK